MSFSWASEPKSKRRVNVVVRPKALADEIYGERFGRVKQTFWLGLVSAAKMGLPAPRLAKTLD
jgi:hypothetical protein